MNDDDVASMIVDGALEQWATGDCKSIIQIWDEQYGKGFGEAFLEEYEEVIDLLYNEMHGILKEVAKELIQVQEQALADKEKEVEQLMHEFH
jgi:hypothetical protein